MKKWKTGERFSNVPAYMSSVGGGSPEEERIKLRGVTLLEPNDGVATFDDERLAVDGTIVNQFRCWWVVQRQQDFRKPQKPPPREVK